MKSLYPISLLLAACSLLTAQDTMPTRSLRGTGRPRTTTSTAPQIYLSSTIAGTPGTAGYAGDTGPATAALLSSPLAVAVDSKGNLYISDYGNNLIREVYASNGTIQTIAGTSTPGYSGDGGPATSAQFALAHSLAFDAAGNLYIADAPNARIRMINPAGIISTFAGNGTFGYAGDDGPAAEATLYYPVGVTVDSAGNVYIADYGNWTVRKVSAATGNITTVAGVGYPGFEDFPGTGGGPATKALLGLPYAVAVDESGNLFIADIGTSSILKVGTNGMIQTLVSDVSTTSLVTDPAGNLYYADYRNSVINRVLPDGTVVTVGGVSGPGITATAGFSGDGGPANLAEYNAPYGIARDSSGNIYVADSGNQVVRLMAPLNPPNVIVANGASDVGYSSPGVPLPVAPGEVITIFGNNIGFPVFAPAAADANGIFETIFGLTTVTFNGIPAPILVTGPTYVSVVAPYELSGSGATEVKIVVTYNAQPTATATVPYIDASSPGIFTANSTGIWNGLAVLNADGTVNGPYNQAASASTITLFVTGEGQTSPPGIDGLVSGGPNNPTPPTPLLPVSVIINGAAATLVSATEAPGQVAGVLQVQVTLPAITTASNAVPVQVQVGTAVSPTLNIAVQ
jgi:uncharacterized protein (TIGR03437 family)